MNKILVSLKLLEQSDKKLALDLKDRAFELVTLIRQQAEGTLIQPAVMNARQTAFAEALAKARAAQPSVRAALFAAPRKAAIELVEALIVK